MSTTHNLTPRTHPSGIARKLGVLFAGLGVLALASGTALAGGPGGAHYYQRVSAKIERALQSVNATPEQRAAIEQAKQQAFAAIKPIRQQIKAKRAELRQLRDSGTPDQARLQQLRTEKDQLRLQIKTVAQTFVATATQQLSEPQRKALADFIQQHGGIFQVHKRFKRG